MRPDCHLDISALAYTQNEQLLTQEHLKRVFSQKHSVAWFMMMFFIAGGMLILIPWNRWSLPLLILGSLLPLVLSCLLYSGIRRYLKDGIRQAIQKTRTFETLPAEIISMKLVGSTGRYKTVNGVRDYHPIGNSGHRGTSSYVTIEIRMNKDGQAITWKESVDTWTWGSHFSNDSEQVSFPIPIQAIYSKGDSRGWIIGIDKKLLNDSGIQSPQLE